MKLLIGAIAAAIVVAVGVGVFAYSAMTEEKELRHPTQAELRRAMPDLAAAELKSRGHALRRPLTCTDMTGWTARRMRVRCTGVTAQGLPVEAYGAAEKATRVEYFTILVDGRPVVQNAPCLAADCRPED
ncbi:MULTISPECIES: hypothetical protein [Thermomonospora]|uniref:DUF4333 domain-containing protein n=1 Tax=Thermomonospora cellulosilytica TaxID=1411118 RepID=A0A7W3R881_9ACTN|nr:MULTISPECIES: hypothetical protein [Thermomonospora]MBA9003406.1 hypothetical protein [Thermomonospora cellulosilytica]